MIAGHLSGPTVYDFALWTITSLLVIRILRTNEERLWPAVGAAVGLGLLNKETILLLVGGLTLGVLLNRQARVLRSQWLWVGAALAIAIWTPNLVWQARYGWPFFEMSRGLHQEHSGLGYTATFVLINVLLPGWWVLPIWTAGLWALWREGRFRPYRCFAIAYGIVFVLLMLTLGDRPYFVGPFYVVLLAAGAIVARDVVAGVRSFYADRPPRRRLVWRSRRAAIAWISVLAIAGLPLDLPILPPRTLARAGLQNVNYNLGEVYGWPQLVAAVAGVYRSLPSVDRQTAVILTANYGEAGAIDRYGPAFGLPSAYSGHNSYWWWGPPPEPRGATIAVGFRPRLYLLVRFREVSLAARVDNGYGLDNDEQGQPVWICRGQRAGWAALWPGLKHYG